MQEAERTSMTSKVSATAELPCSRCSRSVATEPPWYSSCCLKAPAMSGRHVQLLTRAPADGQFRIRPALPLWSVQQYPMSAALLHAATLAHAVAQPTRVDD